MVVTQKMKQSVRHKVIKFPFIAVSVLFRLFLRALYAYGYTAYKKAALFVNVREEGAFFKFFALYAVKRGKTENVGNAVRIP